MCIRDRGDASLTPAAIAAWAQRQGYAGADGTSWELMRSGCEHFGLKNILLFLKKLLFFFKKLLIFLKNVLVFDMEFPV